MGRGVEGEWKGSGWCGGSMMDCKLLIPSSVLMEEFILKYEVRIVYN